MDTVNKVMELSPNIALVILVVIGIAVILLVKNAKKIKAFGEGIYNTKKKNDEYKKMLINADKKVDEHEQTIKEQDSIIQKLKGEVSNLQKKIEDYEKANEEHWGVSVEYRDKYDERHLETIQAMDKMTEAISSVVDRLDLMQKQTDERFYQSEEKNDKRIRAELKNDISEHYRRHHRTGKISRMALEVLENLIEEYEEAKGDNSFVHSIVQKEMYSWEIVDDFE